jgi:hypothetical protein
MAGAYSHTKMKKLNKENIEDILSLTPMQEGMLFHYLKGPGSEYYFGEYTAACVSGVFSLEEALKLIAFRGQSIRKTPTGAMLSVPLPSYNIESRQGNFQSIKVFLRIRNIFAYYRF